MNSSASKIGPLSRHKSRTSCDGDNDDTDSEVSPAGSFLQETCVPSTSNSTDSAISINISRPITESESPLDGLFLICEALERPARRSGSTGTDRSSEISSPANSPLSESPAQKPSLISLRSAQSSTLRTFHAEDLSVSNNDNKRNSVGCNLFDNISAPPLPDTYQQYSHHHIHHNHDIIQPSSWMPMKAVTTNKAGQNQNVDNSVHAISKKNNKSNGVNTSHFPLSTLFTAAEALLPGCSDNKAKVNSQQRTSAISNVKSTKRAYNKKTDKSDHKTVAVSKSGASTASVGKKSNVSRKPKNFTGKILTEKDIESKKRKREADKCLSYKKRYDVSEKLAIVVRFLYAQVLVFLSTFQLLFPSF